MIEDFRPGAEPGFIIHLGWPKVGMATAQNGSGFLRSRPDPLYFGSRSDSGPGLENEDPHPIRRIFSGFGSDSDLIRIFKKIK